MQLMYYLKNIKEYFIINNKGDLGWRKKWLKKMMIVIKVILVTMEKIQTSIVKKARFSGVAQ